MTRVERVSTSFSYALGLTLLGYFLLVPSKVVAQEDARTLITVGVNNEVATRVTELYRLVETGDQTGFEQLNRALKDPAELIRYHAAKIMGGLKTMLAVKPLAKVALHDASFKVRMRGAQSLYELGIASSLEVLHTALELDNLGNKLLVLRIIEQIRDERSVMVLEKQLLKTERSDSILLFRLQRALDILKGRLDGKLIERAERIVDEAQIAYQNNEVARVKLLVDEALGLDKHNANAYFLLGNLSMHLEKQYEQALKQYQYAQKFGFEGQEEINFNLGTALLFLDRLPEAIEHLGRAAVLGRSARAYYQQAVAYFKAKDLGRAIQCFEAALTIDPEFRDAHCNLAQLYESTGAADKALQHRTLCGIQ